MLKAILIGGLVAGVLDITDALVFWAIKGVPVMRLLQGIAAGVMGGPDAVKGGWPTAILGLALHFTIAMGAAVTYNIAAKWIPLMLRSPWICGPVFGLLVFAFMNLVVLPLSRVHQRPMTVVSAINLIFAHIVCVGLPIALAARRYN